MHQLRVSGHRVWCACNQQAPMLHRLAHLIGRLSLSLQPINIPIKWWPLSLSTEIGWGLLRSRTKRGFFLGYLHGDGSTFDARSFVQSPLQMLYLRILFALVLSKNLIQDLTEQIWLLGCLITNPNHDTWDVHWCIMRPMLDAILSEIFFLVSNTSGTQNFIWP